MIQLVVDLVIALVKIGALVVMGLLVMGLLGLGYAMAMFSWERLRDLWRRE